MATYEELQTLAGGNALIGRIERAITIAADSILTELDTVPNHVNRLIWAKAAFDSPQSQVKAFWNAMLAANKGASVTAILAATDSGPNSIQSTVDAAVNVFAGEL